jgi:hypothetical protein
VLKHGDCVRVNFGTTDLFLINHPDLVEEVMVKKPRFFSKGRVMKKMSRVIGRACSPAKAAITCASDVWRNRRFIASVCRLTAK